MKMHKFVSYASLGIIILAVFLLATLPIRFPSSSIAWSGQFSSLTPAVVLAALLLVKPLLSNKVLLLTTILLAGIAVLITVAGWMSPVLLGIFLVACFAFCLSLDTPRLNLRRK